jgi:hypothetical protein
MRPQDGTGRRLAICSVSTCHAEKCALQFEKRFLFVTHFNVSRLLGDHTCVILLASITCFVAMVTMKAYEGYHAHCQHCPVALFLDEKWRMNLVSLSLHDDLNT